MSFYISDFWREIPGDTCVICGNTSASTPSVSYHRFAANTEKIQVNREEILIEVLTWISFYEDVAKEAI